jgi:hypothetical protein
MPHFCFNLFTWEIYSDQMRIFQTKYGDIYISYVSYNENNFKSNALELINIIFKTILNIWLILFCINISFIMYYLEQFHYIINRNYNFINYIKIIYRHFIDFIEKLDSILW